jgi:hypothetical protein
MRSFGASLGATPSCRRTIRTRQDTLHCGARTPALESVRAAGFIRQLPRGLCQRPSFGRDHTGSRPRSLRKFMPPWIHTLSFCSVPPSPLATPEGAGLALFRRNMLSPPWNYSGAQSLDAQCVTVRTASRGRGSTAVRRPDLKGVPFPKRPVGRLLCQPLSSAFRWQGDRDEGPTWPTGGNGRQQHTRPALSRTGDVGGATASGTCVSTHCPRS